MKNALSILLILWITNGSCQVSNLKLYCIKISPIGNSDVPLNTLYITSDKSFSLPNDRAFSQLILTNEETMDKLIPFIKKYNLYRNDKLERFSEYGCNNISIFDNKVLVKNYKLNRSESINYFKSLIKMLNKNSLDEKLIIKLNEALGRINI